ncbi:hypothetical protein [Hymenobacter chitinivorans]|uniref:Dolichyl-phosphate-mannose-protein mannosyltransferase n=1 Tax=Hymenobacter chitinivorans DSM 11115 TaxID=1121954 RepID=A0A2M9BM26_9BACT|nr:hypothetical protein [Hymenobacter chitinivorans]PJJ58999.1 hypothetical protein CLV45_0412 [Hymenobacter chitinivorans DSM 11115]
MKLQDLLLTPIYLAIFYGIAYGVRGKVTNVFTRRYFIPALSVKFLGAIALGLVYQFYYGGGDTFNYTKHVDIIYDAFGESPVAAIKLIFSHGEFDPVTAPYTVHMYWYKSSTEFFVVQIAAVLSLLCFNTYSVMALMFAGISFSGMWAMYLTFIRAYPLLYKRFAIAVFFLPSVFFWGSGVMKDSLCLGALGWVFYGFYHATVLKRNIFFSIVVGLIGAYVLITVKVYILLSFMPPALIWVFIENNRRIKSAALRMVLKPFFLVLGVGAGFLGATNLTAQDDRFAVDKIGERTKINQEYLYTLTKDQGSAYNIGAVDGSLGSLVTVAPQAVIVSLFRPFLFEARNPVMLLSAIEATMFIYLTVMMFYRTGIIKSFKQIASTPMVTFCFLFAIVFAIGVGTNSGNFGTLVRYKIPLMPFYLAALYIMQFQANNAKKLSRFASTEKRASMVARAA